VLKTGGRQQHQLAEDLAATLEEITNIPDLLASLSLGARVRARQFHFHDLVKSVYADVPVDRMVGQA